ncbi:MAG: AMP-binding protein [Actinomycetota bacterium]|nr:AMP-binding protein [Actinomycetota bacterium]
MIPKSAVSNVSWPAVPSPSAAVLLALQQQLQETEWLATAELERLQLEELSRLLRHACETVPYYRDGDDYAALARSGEASPAYWARLPVLTRADVQQAGDALHSEAVPADHQPLAEALTSGSTGRPVRAVGSVVTGLFWMAITLREQLWHGRDLGGTLAAIRAEQSDRMPAEGLTLDGWGPALDTVYRTGPCQLFSIQHDIEAQAEWLRRQNPDVLLTYPSNLMALAQHFIDSGSRLPRLRDVSTYGEAVTPDVRTAVSEAWGARLIDMYSTQEVGYIALQCPRAERYHVQAESVYVEVLDEDGEPCKPGQVGSVVVSTLHNYAMPLIRYEVGDYAEVGEPCACGRGLPVLNRVMGRQRNMMELPSGQKVWPTFPAKSWAHIEAIKQLQIVQTAPDQLQAKIVGPRPLSKKEKSEFATMLQNRFGHPFRVSFDYVDEIPRSGSLKYEDFISQLRP